MKLLAYLQSFSTRLLERVHEAEAQVCRAGACLTILPLTLLTRRQVDRLAHDSTLSEVALSAEVLRFDALSNSQFIENVRCVCNALPLRAHSAPSLSSACTRVTTRR